MIAKLDSCAKKKKTFLPQISRPLAHGLDGVVQLGRGDLSGVGHVLGQEILKGLPD